MKQSYPYKYTVSLVPDPTSNVVGIKGDFESQAVEMFHTTGDLTTTEIIKNFIDAFGILSEIIQTRTMVIVKEERQSKRPLVYQEVNRVRGVINELLLGNTKP